MFERLVFLLDKGGMVIVLSCLCVGFFFLHAKIKEICRRVTRVEDLVIELLEEQRNQGKVIRGL